MRSDGVAVIPLLELHDDLDALLLAHGANAEDRRDVDQPDAANLHVVAAAARARARSTTSRPRRRRDDEIVGHERWPRSTRSSTHSDLPMPLLPTNSRPTPNTSASDPCRLVVGANSSSSHGLSRVVELVGLEVRADQRDAGGRREVDQIRARLLPLRDEDARNRKREERASRFSWRIVGSIDLRYVISVSPSTCRRCAGNRADVAGEHEAGTRHVRILDRAIESVRSVDVLELERVLAGARAAARRSSGLVIARFPAAITR